ncbi:MAG TPA: FtsX-like permease family protein [Terriglobales bacterium]|nr:FtsX-like permease family protein [Terriglobales bacterium]
MKYRHIIFANIFRKKMRLLLTLGSFTVAMFLFGLLAVVRTAFVGGVDVAGADRLVTINKTSIIQPLPLSYKERLLRIKGVKAVTYANWFGGIYQDERNFFANFAIDKDTYFEMYPEFVIPPDQKQAFMEDREGAVVGKQLAERFGWKVGDRIPIKGTIFPGTWDFNIRAIYEGKRAQDDTSQLWFRWDYFEERKPFQKGFVGWYTIRVEDPGESVNVVKAIDDTFANSPWETKTDTEKAFAASWVKQMGNIQFLINTIGAVVFFTLLLVTGNTMAIAVRERIRELAVLKAIGFSDKFVLFLVIAESLFVAVLGGALGLGLAKLMTLGGDPTRGMMPIFYLSPPAVTIGAILAIGVGILAAIIPATTAMRLRVVEALRRV